MILFLTGSYAISRKRLYIHIFVSSAKGVGLLKGARVQIPASPLKSLRSV